MPEQNNDVALLQNLTKSITALKSEISKSVIGQREIVEELLASLLTGGHCLIIGVPGLAKTTLIQVIAKALTLDFKRIQFTPDLMPSDITGSEILFEDKSTGKRELTFAKGPLFANLILADEINRTPPKTQSALLQAMQEHEVTSSGKTWQLPAPFWVLATQNPIEQEGTYPLPEAQQDRFMFSLEINYPDYESEIEIARTTTAPQNVAINKILSAEEILTYQKLIWNIPVADSVVKFAVKLARATRPESEECPHDIKGLLTWGAGPRASQYLIRAAKSYAALDNRTTPDIEDIKRAAYPVLRHRLVRSFHAEVDGISTNEIIAKLLDNIKK